MCAAGTTGKDNISYIAILLGLFGASYVANVGGARGGDDFLYFAIFTRTVLCLECGKCWGCSWRGPQVKTTFCILHSLLGMFHAPHVANVGGTRGGDHWQRRL